MATTQEFKGIHAVLYAFFDRDERLDRAAMRTQMQAVLDAGVDGIVVLGLATEVAKLTATERRTLMEWAAEDLDRRAPLGVTIFGGSVAEQIEDVRAAESCGAKWLILQPPLVGSYGPAEYIRFFGRVADTANVPVAIQNAPAYLGRGLSASEIKDLTTQHPNVRLLKGEGPATDICAVIEATGGRVPVFNGRGGLELTDNLRAGCAGFILAPDVIDLAVQAFAHWSAGRHAEAEQLYARMLPATVFAMQSIEGLICYGKRLAASRIGLEVFDRAPAMRPTELGLQIVSRFAEQLGPL